MHPAFSVEVTDGLAEADLGWIDALDAQADWSDREVTIAELGGWLQAHAHVRRVVVRGARIFACEDGRRNDLTDLRLDCAVVLRDCSVGPALSLDHALLGRLDVDGCVLRGGVRLENAKVRGGLRITGGTRIEPVDGISIEGSHASLGAHLEVEAGARLEGGLRLNGANIGGYLSVEGGAQIAADPSSGWSVDADWLEVTGGLFVHGEGTRLVGGLRLLGANVGGQVALRSGAQIAADPWSGCSVAADGLGVTGGLYVEGDGTRLEGELRLVGASVGGQLAIRDGARVEKDLDLEAAEVTILTIGSGQVGGVVDLSHTRLGRLDDDPQGWQQGTGGWRLAGITIDALSGTLRDSSRWTTKQRIDWLNNDQSPSRRPYTQVADLYRQAGHREHARKVAVAGEKVTSSWFRRLWAGATVGYGYQPWRAAIAAVVLIVATWTPIALFGDDILTETTTDARMSCPDDFPCRSVPLYLTEAVVPVVDFGQRDAWRIDPNTPYAAQLQTVEYLLDGLGWVLALLLLSAVTGLIRKE